MNPDLAAQWMRQNMLRTGLLLQRDAANYLRQFSDETLAYVDYADSLCVGRKTLARFRKLSPDAAYDRRLKGWKKAMPSRSRCKADRPGSSDPLPLPMPA